MTDNSSHIVPEEPTQEPAAPIEENETQAQGESESETKTQETEAAPAETAPLIVPMPLGKKPTLTTLLRAFEIDGRWFRQNLWLLLVITIGLLAFVTNRYQADQEIIEEDNLNDTLEDIRYKALTKAADLTLKKRSSNIEELLRQRGDSSLQAPKDAPYILQSPSQHGTEPQAAE